MGPADRWQDIAIAVRSLGHNFDGRYSDGKRIFDFKPRMLLDALEIELDEEKYRMGDVWWGNHIVPAKL